MSESETQPPAHAREAAGSLADFCKISEKWIADAAAERRRLGLGLVNLRKEAAKLELLWSNGGPPHDPYVAWLAWARKAKPPLYSAEARVVDLVPHKSDKPDEPAPLVAWPHVVENLQDGYWTLTTIPPAYHERYPAELAAYAAELEPMRATA